MSIRRYLSELVKDEILAVREVFFSSKLLLAVFLLCLIGVIVYLEPFPDRHIYVGSSYEGSDWYRFSDEAAVQLKKNGIDATSVVTEGAVDNVRRLIDPKGGVDVAMTYGFALEPGQEKQVVSLGSVSYEPIWIFYHADKIRKVDNLHDFSKYHVGLGPAWSGSFAISKKLFSFYGIDVATNKNFSSMPFEDLQTAFLSGKVDAFVMVMTERDPVVQKMMQTPGVRLFGFKDADAFEKTHNSLRKVVLPAGSINLYPQIPAADIPLIATTSSVVVRPDMHPSLQFALLMTAKQIVRDSQHLFFTARNEFPAYVDPLIPISPVAARFYDYGPPQAMRYLPFWIGGFIDRVWLIVLGLVAIFYPLSKLNVRIRTLRFVAHRRPLYKELLAIDKLLMEKQCSAEEQDKICERLLQIHNESLQSGGVPVGEERSYFILLSAVKLLEDKLKSKWTC